jgi:hypothetical protein
MRLGDVVMKKVHTAVVLASALGGLLLAPLAVMANAHGLGFGAHPIHFRGHFGPAHRNAAYGQWPGYGGVVAVAPDASDNTSDNTIVYATPEEVAFVPEPSRMLSCHHSQQIVTVPSEQGGTRQITITRC